MRSICLLLTVGAMTLAVQSTMMDTATADWVFGVICSNNGSDGKPLCDTTKQEEENKTNPDEGFNLNPTNVDNNVYCMTKDNKNGICVLYYLCDQKTNTIIDDGASIIDLRLNVCPHYLEVCCKENDVENNRNGPDTPDKPKNAASGNLFYAFDSTMTTQVAVTTSPAPAPAPTTTTTKKPLRKKSKRVEACGWSNPGVAPKLRSSDVGETSPYANYGDFPWMVALLKKTGDDDVWSDGDYLGGGTLIHPSVVITAAHKLTIKKEQFKASELRCRAGEWDTQTTYEMFPHQDRDVAKYIIHEHYYRISVLNDVALLIMKEPFDLVNEADHMGTGCLATSLPPDGYSCYSMGWGKDFNKKEKTLPSVLKKVPLRMVEHDKCEKKLIETRLGHVFWLNESLTCAEGEPGVDTCRGDGGSPLVCPVATNVDERRYAVYGMVVYGIGPCGNPKAPGVYVNIPHLKSWVDEKMQEEGFDTSYYTI